MTSFSDLGLKKNILEIIEKMGYKQPLEIQMKAIPLILKKKNVIFQSQTGSGKTLAFTVGFLSRLNIKQGLQMVVFVPTRELCIQVGSEIKKMCEPINLNVGTIFGGRNIKIDYKTYDKKNQIIVATPGRFLTHVNQRTIKTGEVKYMVYDECDEMFDTGFYDDCVYMRKRISKDAQIILSSATLSNHIKEFIDKHIGEHELIKIGDLVPKNITFEKIYCKIPEKNEILLKILSKKFRRCIIFCNAKNRLVNVVEFLSKNHYTVKPISSDYQQKERENFIKDFRLGKVRVLVATDVAARGLDIPDVDIVINFDIPNTPRLFIHRSGRSGRLDHKGHVVSLICPEDKERYEDIVFEFLHDIDLK